MYAIAQHILTRPRLVLKTQPKFFPVSLRLSMFSDVIGGATESVKLILILCSQLKPKVTTFG
jgi:hypothetical protein